MKSIRELGLEFFISRNNLDKYDLISKQNKPVEEIIYDLLTLNPGFMDEVPNNQLSILSEGESSLRRIISEHVSSYRKLEFITLYFNSKSAKKTVSNNFVYPDASDFLTLLHLSIVFKKINEVYLPGASLYIGTEFNYFHRFSTQDLRTTSEMTAILMKFKIIIETMIKSNTYIFLFDIYEEISFFKKDFLASVEKEKFNYLSRENALEDLKQTANYYFDFVIEQSAFPSEEAARNFCIFHSLDAAGYSAAIRSLPNLDKGFFKDFQNKILVNPRVFKNSHSRTEKIEVYLPLLPGSFTFSFNMLSLRKSNGRWSQITFENVKNDLHREFFVQDLPYPFFFTEDRSEGDFE